MARRRYSSDRAIGVLILVALVMWVVSVIIEALIIGAVVALVVGMIWFVARHVKTIDPPKLVVAQQSEPTRATPPEAPYRPLAPPDPAVFDEPALAEVAGLNVFRVWAGALPSAPKDSTVVVRDMKLRTRAVGRLLSECAVRHVVWRGAPYTGQAKLTTSPISPSRVDPWNVDLEALRAESRHHGWCRRCGATGHANCEVCHGSTHSFCAVCNGIGIQCPVCDGKRKVVQWLDVQEYTARVDIQVEPDGDVTRAFAWGKDGSVASDPEISADAKLLATCEVQGSFTAADLPEIVPSTWVKENWERIQPRLQHGERVRSQRFSYLEIPSVEVTYSLDNQASLTVEFEGRRLIAPPPTVDTLFHRRAHGLRVLAYSLAIVPLAILVLYLARGEYFLSAQVAGVIACAVGACAGLYGFFRLASLGRRSARWWVPVVALPVIGAALLGYLAEPRLSRATALVEAGNRDAALRELRALGAPADADLAPLYAKVYLVDAKAASNWNTAYASAKRIPEGQPARGEALDHAFTLMAADVRGHLARAQVAEARAVLDAVPTLGAPMERGALVDETVIAAVTQCQQAEQWDCVFNELDGHDLGERGIALQEETLATIHSQAQALTDGVSQINERSERIEIATKAMAAWSLWTTKSGGALPNSAAKVKQQLAVDVAHAAEELALERERQAEEDARWRRSMEALDAEARRNTARQSRGCCKVCTKGCACGDSCISCKKSCRKAPGCAC